MRPTAPSLLLAALLAACGNPSKASSESSPDATPGKPTGAADAAKPPATPAPARPDADGASSGPTAEAVPLKVALGGVSKIELFAGAAGPGALKPAGAIDDAADVTAALDAIGTDQAPLALRRRCPDTVRLVFSDAAGKPRGSLGFCDPKGITDDMAFEGPQFAAQAGGPAGVVKLANPGALRTVVVKHAKK